MIDYEFEEDPEPTWLVKQRKDALLAEQAYNKNEKLSTKRAIKLATSYL